jgi:pyruvate dehydrogenase E2 component (dihydrolipoamide acetyltransferase)
MAEIRMPKMGDGMEEGTINVWLKKEGDSVTSGEPIAEVETDKANVEISAYETGTLTKIVVAVGQTVPVGAVIALVNEAGGAAAASSGTGNGQAKVEAPVAVVAAPVVPAPVAQAAVSSDRVKASPLARKMMTELNVDAALVTATGPGGRIVERDVAAFLADAKPLAATAPVAASTAPVVERSANTTTTGYDEIKPTRMRDAIARRTQQSTQQIPHFYTTMVIEMDRALAMVKELNKDNPEGKVTVNDLLVKACAIAIARVPEVNSSWTPDNTIKRYHAVHVGVAVGIDDGLIIPVVRDCGTKTLRQISVEAKALIGKARAGTLKPDEFSGSTFSISNLGMMGVDQFTAIINTPEAAILAVGGVSRDYVVNADDTVRIASRMKVTLSADHRILDGVVSAKFLNELKKILEAPFAVLS